MTPQEKIMGLFREIHKVTEELCLDKPKVILSKKDELRIQEWFSPVAYLLRDRKIEKASIYGIEVEFK